MKKYHDRVSDIIKFNLVNSDAIKYDDTLLLKGLLQIQHAQYFDSKKMVVFAPLNG